MHLAVPTSLCSFVKKIKSDKTAPETGNDMLYSVEGIRGVGTHIFAERFSGETASYRAANLIYMAACLMAETPYEPIDSFKEYANEQLSQADLKVLSKMRKAQPVQYAYLVKADRLLKECRKQAGDYKSQMVE